jgi:hypothetical protein
VYEAAHITSGAQAPLAGNFFVLEGRAVEVSAPNEPADLGAEGDGQHHQGERGDGHGGKFGPGVKLNSATGSLVRPSGV